jgi:Arc/MetJ-type ribon-helix-helix transcriptional regulator
MSTKERLSATVDADLITAAQEAVEAGRADSVSSWVNDALRMKADQDTRLAALDDFLAAFESEHGEISDEEMQAAARRARKRAVVVRGRPASQDPTSPGRGGPSSC